MTNKDEKLELCLKFLSALSLTPRSIASVSEDLRFTDHQMMYVRRKLKRAKLTQYIKDGICLIPDTDYSKENLRGVLGLSPVDPIKEVLCIECNEVKPRKLCFTDSGKRYYTDPDSDNRWKLKKCPDCVAASSEEEKPLPIITSRKCRDCNKFLPPERYFRCLGCQPQLPSIEDDYVYDSFGIDEHTEIMCEGINFEGEEHESIED